MPFVIVNGPGSWSCTVNGRFHRFKSGGTEVTDELADELSARRVPAWVSIDAEPLPPRQSPAPEPEAEADEPPEPVKAKPAPYAKFRGRDGKWYFHDPAGGEFEQRGPYADEKDADAAIDEAKTDAEREAREKDEADKKAAAEAAEAERQRSRVPDAGEVAREGQQSETGTLTSQDLDPGEDGLPCGKCDKKFSTSGERANHERVMHSKSDDAEGAGEDEGGEDAQA